MGLRDRKNYMIHVCVMINSNVAAHIVLLFGIRPIFDIRQNTEYLKTSVNNNKAQEINYVSFINAELTLLV